MHSIPQGRLQMQLQMPCAACVSKTMSTEHGPSSETVAQDVLHVDEQIGAMASVAASFALPSRTSRKCNRE